MKPLSLLSAFLFGTGLSAQCTFTPTVSPNDLILCPFTEALLSTGTYDAYQWYKDGELIEGATSQTLTVSSMDAVSSFAVEATLNGCTEMSAEVLVDAWAFLLPFVIHAGDEPLYIEGEGVQHNCEGDTVLLILNYSQQVRWYHNGSLIEGESDDTLVVVQDGSYTCEGAPDECPDFVMPLGVEVGIRFDPPVQPILSFSNDGLLCAEPEGVAYQWYLFDAPLAGDQACIEIASEGSYTVAVTYDPDCSIPSAPFVVTGLGDQEERSVISVFPVPAKDHVTVRWNAAMEGSAWEMVDIVGRRMMDGERGATSEQVIDISSLPQGRYWLRSAGETPMLIAVMR